MENSDTEKERVREQAPQPPKTRRRQFIFSPDRVTVSLRMDPSLHKELMGHCDAQHLVANTYINGLIEDDLRQRRAGLAEFEGKS